MQEEIIQSYRERLANRLYDYLEAEGLLGEPLSFTCPCCRGGARIADEARWFCPECGRSGGLLDLARARFPGRGEWELIRQICTSLKLKITELETFTGAELAAMELRPREYLVEGLLPSQGVTLLAAPAKTGKSWLVLQLAAALVKGEPFLEQPTKKCRVLYLSLEDTPLRLQERSRLLGCLGSPDLHFCTRAQLLGKGFEEGIDGFLQGQEGMGLIIVDTLQKIREVGAQTPTYGMEYRVMDRLKDLAERHHMALLLVHHTNKKEEAEDAMNMVSGTMAITGGVDGIWLLRRPKRLEGRALLQATGRDTPDVLLRLDFDRELCRWRFLGFEEGSESLEVNTSEQDRQRLQNALLDFMQPGEEWYGTATELLEQLELDGEITAISVGKHLRRMEPELERLGLLVELRRDRAQRLIHILRRETPPESRERMTA